MSLNKDELFRATMTDRGLSMLESGSVEALLDRFPGLRLAVPVDEIPWKSGLLVRGPEKLLVAW